MGSGIEDFIGMVWGMGGNTMKWCKMATTQCKTVIECYKRGAYCHKMAEKCCRTGAKCYESHKMMGNGLEMMKMSRNNGK